MLSGICRIAGKWKHNVIGVAGSICLCHHYRLELLWGMCSAVSLERAWDCVVSHLLCPGGVPGGVGITTSGVGSVGSVECFDGNSQCSVSLEVKKRGCSKYKKEGLTVYEATVYEARRTAKSSDGALWLNCYAFSIISFHILI